MKLVQAASVCAPECISVPTNDRGVAVFKLDQLAPANGFNHANAHDALADVEATIHMARCVLNSAPDCWNRFIRFSSKPSVRSFIDDEEAFVLTEFYFNRPYHYVIAPIALDPANGSAFLCLDLNNDLDDIAAKTNEQLVNWAKRSPKPIRLVKMNAAPNIAAIDEVPATFLGSLSLSDITERAQRLKSDDLLRDRLVAAIVNGRPSVEPSLHFEEQIYDRFILDGDQARMDEFHMMGWPERAALVNTFEDDRLKYHGQRLVFEHDPSLLSSEVRAEIIAHHSSRLMEETADCQWTTLHSALSAINEMAQNCSASERAMLDEYRTYVTARISAGGWYH